jgi:two-component system, chemotaxis family, response regulator Rcp1
MTNEVPLQPIEILLVEDSFSDATLTIKSFQNTKIANNLHWVEDGETAMEYLRNQGAYQHTQRPDIILLDLNLPGMDGREVLTEVKSDPNLKYIPVIVITTSADERDILCCYNLNASCYITKPIDVKDFINTVNLIQDFWLTVVKLPPP